MSGMAELLNEDGATTAAEPTPAPVAEPAPASPAVEPSSQPEAQPPVQAEPQDPMAPVKALLDERDRRQAAERKAASLEAREAEQERRRREAAAKAPNVLDNPEGYHAYWENRHRALEQSVSQQAAMQRMQDRLEDSEEKWRDKLGDEFDTFFKWAGAAPDGFRRHCESQRDPYGVAFQEYDKQRKAKEAEELTSKLQGKGLEAFIAEQVEARIAAQAAAAPAQPAKPVPPRAPDGTFTSHPPQRHRPESLAKVNGSAVANVPSTSGSALDGLIGD